MTTDNHDRELGERVIAGDVSDVRRLTVSWSASGEFVAGFWVDGDAGIELTAFRLTRPQTRMLAKAIARAETRNETVERRSRENG
ncbi:MAG TPA: hypothetical protein VMY34_09245 [Acidimicrobiales bacterium]|nr:hypothetical protein [Acidimicrobiales bacterium]